MPFTDLNGALRLVHRIDEILALVRSWSEEQRFRNAPITRQIPISGLAKFEELDARIGGLMNALGFVLPPSLIRVSSNSPSKPFVHGFTELGLPNRQCMLHPHEWERRILAVRHAAEEILDVARSNESDKRLPDTPRVRELCALLAKKAASGRPLIQIARDLTGEKPKKDRTARSLLRQAQRYRHLWQSDDK